MINIEEHERKRQSERAKKRLGIVGDLRKGIEIICNNIGSTKYEKFINAILDDDLINDLFESTTNPINIHNFRLYEDHIEYRTRNAEEKIKKIKTIRNILSKIQLVKK